MEPSKKQLSMEAKRNQRPVTVETGRPWLGLGGWLQRKEQAPWEAGPTCRWDWLKEWFANLLWEKILFINEKIRLITWANSAESTNPLVSLPRFLSYLRWVRVEPALLLSVFTPALLAEPGKPSPLPVGPESGWTHLSSISFTPDATLQSSLSWSCRRVCGAEAIEGRGHEFCSFPNLLSYVYIGISARPSLLFFNTYRIECLNTCIEC
jgi:hypothetical protein